ncbi:MAG: hypothetical protein K6F80_06550 [Oscillospiraceae bacterium]|nr:hypothetical protein [Oscillospiraceae bacterium]
MNEYETIYQHVPQGNVLTSPAVKEPVTYTGAERITAALMMLLGFFWVRMTLYHARGAAR